MLKRLKKLVKNQRDNPVAPRVIPAGDHGLRTEDISTGAREIIDVLGSKGFEAYVVGGCVRDLLLGMNPKDFDVATNATPEEVNRLFRRSRIIGRRFQIVHVRMGREVIEVTTFRGSHESGDGLPSQKAHRNPQGLLLRDNIFGSIEQDAARRDFTINAFYYHPQDNTLFDYANGQADLERRLIRVIGDPEVRYREDPVRMLRAIRFAAKLDFQIEPVSSGHIDKLGFLLLEIPAARLFDESLKILLGGYASRCFPLLESFKLVPVLFPATAKALAQQQESHNLINQAIGNTDERINTNKRVTPAFIFAALLWPAVRKYQQRYEEQGDTPPYALSKAASKAIAEQCKIIAIPRRFSMAMREIWELQLRLPMRQGKRAQRLLELPRFRAGYDFLLLREQSGEIEPGLGEWWTAFQEADTLTRESLVAALGAGHTRKPRRRRPRRRKSSVDPE